MKSLWVRSLFLLLAGTIFFVVLGVALTWAPDIPVDQLKARWAQPPSTFVRVNGMDVHVRDEGPRTDPVPIVLLHGTSASLHTWDGWAQALHGQRRVIRLDLPGFALTGPNREDDYSIDTYVLFLRGFLDKLGLEKVVLGGNSLGGQIAWAAAAKMPDRVERLILVDAAGYPPQSYAAGQSIPIGFRIMTVPGLRLLAEHTLPRGVVESSVRNVYGDPAKVTPELVDLYADMARREGNRAALARRLEQGYTGDVAQLAKIKAPTLILWGSKDRLIPPELAQRFAHDIPQAKLVMFDGLGHVPQEEDPARTVAEVRRFLGS